MVIERMEFEFAPMMEVNGASFRPQQNGTTGLAQQMPLVKGCDGLQHGYVATGLIATE